jgi:hypothetical protein
MDRLSARLKGLNPDAPKPGAGGASSLLGGFPAGVKPPSMLADPKAPVPEAAADESAIQTLRRMEAKLSTFKAKPEKAGEAYARRMADGEGQMQSGAYFDAEGSFSLALLVKPRDPIAAVARAHAQLGAGLLLSAAAGLREVLATAPELIGTRYERKILPALQRAESAARTIQGELAKPDSALGTDGALLLAYLGRHFDQAEWLKEGLAALERRTRADDTAGIEMLSVLKRVWGGAEVPPPAPAQPAIEK